MNGSNGRKLVAPVQQRLYNPLPSNRLFQIRNKKHLEASPTLSASGAKLQKDFRAQSNDPVAELKSRIASDTADLETVRLCLSEYMERLQQLSRSHRRKVLLADRLGGLTLEWLWKDQARWVPVFTGQDWAFLNTLGFMLPGEKLDDVVLGLLKLPLPAAPSVQLSEENQHRWRGTLLRAVVNGHMVLSSNFSADPGLDLFFGVLDEIWIAKGDRQLRGVSKPIVQTSIWPAVIALGSTMAIGHTAETTPEKYDRFLAILNDYQASQTSKDMRLTIIQLLVVHPRQPTAEPLIRFFRDGEVPRYLLKNPTRVPVLGYTVM